MTTLSAPHFPERTQNKMGKKIQHRFSFFLGIVILLTACSPQIQQSEIKITINADGANHQIQISSEDTVGQALDIAKISLGATDRVEPPTYTRAQDAMTIVITRVTENFETKQIVVAYERQELHNESLTSGETRLVQAGRNGLNEITIRHVFENNIEKSSSIVSETVLQESLPEIVMIGVQAPFAPLVIPGSLVYLTGGNAWIMDGSTASRRPLMTSGDLDGHIFSLSSDGQWLLFTRKSSSPADQQINTLWVVSTSVQTPSPISLNVSNVVHFANWQPEKKYLIAYSTVEPRSTAPGWQANNDLHLLTFENGKPTKTFDALEANSGGLYGWWGMAFSWSPDGNNIAYSRPDGVGLVDLGGAGLTTLMEITPWNTHGDWAWTPGITWAKDNRTLYLVNHAAPSGLITAEESTNFDLASISLSNNVHQTLIQHTGMFAYPTVSSLRKGSKGESFLLAYLQAIFPSQSATSRYRLVVTDNDGSNPRFLFPAEGQPGLEPQMPTWAPRVLDSGKDFIGILYAGNLWIVDAASGQSQQVTGDGLTSKIDWK
jgi:resuscitation-promoting factor RpfB